MEHIRIDSYRFKLCNKRSASSVNPKMHVRSPSGTKLCLSELYGGTTESCQSSTLPKRVGTYTEDDHCVDGTVLSTYERLPHISSSPDEKLRSENHSVINSDINDFILRPYGCGYCNDVFDIEKTFVDHCYNHCCFASQEDTLDELIHMCLLT